jgi:hypothetical protein
MTAHLSGLTRFASATFAQGRVRPQADARFPLLADARRRRRRYGQSSHEDRIYLPMVAIPADAGPLLTVPWLGAVRDASCV